MTRIKLSVAALVVVLCVSALAAAGASAATKKGELVNSKSAVLVKKKFTGEGGKQLLETTDGANLRCTSTTGAGEVLSKTSSTFELSIKGCQLGTGGTCHSAGAAPEEIQAKSLSLGPVLSPKHQTDLFLLTVNKEVEFECREVKGKIRGKFLMAIPALNEEKLSKTVTFTAKESKGVQEFQEYDVKDEPMTGTLEFALGKRGYEQCGVEGENTLTYEEEAKFI